MPASAPLERLEETVLRLSESGADLRTLRLRVLGAVRRAIPFDAYAWVLTDPDTTVGSSPLAAVPSLAELPRLIRLRYLTPVNRWTTLAEPPVARLADITRGRLDESLVWRELLARYDVSDVASVVFRDRYGSWAFLELWRTGGSTFTRAEADVLADVVPGVTAALRAGQARTFAGTPDRPRLSGPLVLQLSPELVVRQTADTRDPLRALVPRDDGGPTVPAGAYNVAAQLLAVETGVDWHPPTSRVHLTGGLWLTLRAARLEDVGPSTERDIAVTIEESTAAERVGLFTRAAGLSEREAEVVGHLVAGSDTREVARRMLLTPNTVQDHLKSVFTKTGTRSRRALLARALGT
jgi:DNA-binding CsgD family transcriptional regulator